MRCAPMSAWVDETTRKRKGKKIRTRYNGLYVKARRELLDFWVLSVRSERLESGVGWVGERSRGGRSSW